MKYKDFKMLSVDDMKQIVGGNVPVGGCAEGETTWQCPTEGSGYPGNYICTGPVTSGACSTASSCSTFCKKPNGSTYWVIGS